MSIPSHSSTDHTSVLEPPTVVGKLDADRLCRKCLHQLSGQMVYRDARLLILYTRCPECGDHAAVTEFPIAGRWMRRFGTLVVVLLVLLGLVLLSFDSGISTAALYESADSALFSTRARFQIEAKALIPNADQPTQQQMDNFWAPPELVASQDAIERVRLDPASIAERWGRLWWSVLPAVLTAAISGAVWSGLLLHRPLRFIWLWLLVPTGLSLVFVTFAWWVEDMDLARSALQSGTSYRSLAFVSMGPPLLLAAAGVMLVVRIISFVIARPVLRGMGMLLLPSKLRRAVADFWSSELPPVIG